MLERLEDSLRKVAPMGIGALAGAVLFGLIAYNSMPNEINRAAEIALLSAYGALTGFGMGAYGLKILSLQPRPQTN